MEISLIICIIGGLVYLFTKSLSGFGGAQAFVDALGELGKYSFIVGLAMWLFGK